MTETESGRQPRVVGGLGLVGFMGPALRAAADFEATVQRVNYVMRDDAEARALLDRAQAAYHTSASTRRLDDFIDAELRRWVAGSACSWPG